MFGWLRRRRHRRHLALVAGAVPVSLAGKFGPAPTYTPAQVERVAEDLRLDKVRVEVAIAACCTEADFLQACAGRTAADYRRLRLELIDTFDIDRPKFTCEHLLRLKDVPRSAAWNPNRTEHDHAGHGSGSSGHGHGSGD